MSPARYGLLLGVSIMALSALQLAPAFGWLEPSEQLHAAISVGRLGLAGGLLALLAKGSGVPISRVVLYGVPLLALVGSVFWAIMPAQDPLNVQALPAGEQTFANLCMDCHGPMGVGGYGPSLDDNIWLRGSGSRADLQQALLSAHSLPFDQLIQPLAQEDLLDYLQSLQP